MASTIRWLGPALFLLGAGAIATAKYTDTGDIQPEAPVEQQAEFESEASVSDGQVYLTTPPLVVPVVRDGRTRKFVSFVLLLGTDKKNARKTRKIMTRLTDAYLKDLNGMLAFDRLQGDSLNLPSIRRRLMATTMRAVGPDLINDIRFKLVTERVPF
jgi:hypothetical protein